MLKDMNFADMNIFDESIFNQNISYQKATCVLNNDGKLYDEYGFCNDVCDIEAIFYEGHNKTKVFAYLGIPRHQKGDKLPAIILQHGGLGKAERDWVRRWNEHGFVAIAPDLYGDGPEEDKNNPYNTNQKRHPYAGIYPWDYTAFLEDYKNSGMYQNVINIVYAHNLLRSLDCVDIKKIGMTGISWGGVVTTITAGVDRRLAFAATVYGCGHLAESKSYFKKNILEEGKTQKWDPSHFAAKAHMPMLYVNGDTDEHFSIDIFSATYLDTPNATLSIHHKLVHGQYEGDSIEQVYTFARNVVDRKEEFVKITSVSTGVEVVVIDISQPVEKAILYYITDEVFRYNDDGKFDGWCMVDEYIVNNGKIIINNPQNATFGYISVIDKNGNIISTPFMKLR